MTDSREDLSMSLGREREGTERGGVRMRRSSEQHLAHGTRGVRRVYINRNRDPTWLVHRLASDPSHDMFQNGWDVRYRTKSLTHPSTTRSPWARARSQQPTHSGVTGRGYDIFRGTNRDVKPWCARPTPRETPTPAAGQRKGRANGPPDPMAGGIAMPDCERAPSRSKRTSGVSE